MENPQLADLVPPAGYLLALDVEATCDENNALPRHDMEIIEIGAVLLDAQLKPVAEFQRFIKPFKHPQLTAFCTRLTSIRQQDVDTAQGVHEVFAELARWLADYRPLNWCSWGDYDYRQFRLDCDRSGAVWPFPGQHFNAKKVLAQELSCKKLGLAEATDFLGLEWVGTHHRGIDDARNIANILHKLRELTTLNHSKV